MAVKTIFTTRKSTLAFERTLLVTIVGTLCGIGLLFIYSASYVYALEHFHKAHYYVIKQLIGLTLGIVSMILIRMVPFEWIEQSAPYIFASTLVLTALTLLPGIGTTINGSARWLFFKGISIQPSELLKIGLLVYLASYLKRRAATLTSFLHGFLPFISMLTLVGIILLKQPDFGLAVTLAITAFLLYFIAAFDLLHLLCTIGISIPLLFSLIYLKPYRWKRILTFLDPWQDPQGAGFQIIQSLIAIGSGSLVGVGISHSKQKFFYLPMQHTDFIFAIIAEETGFIGCLFLLLLYFLLLYIGLRIAWQLPTAFGRYVVAGSTLLITVQALINLAVVTGMVPTKGIGLPFISYGSSSLVVWCCMIGLIMSALRHAES